MERERSFPALNLSTGAMVLRSITVFLSHGLKASEARTTSENQLKKSKRSGGRNMSPPINKLHPKVIEYLRRKTNFNKVEIEGLNQIFRKILSTANTNTYKSIKPRVSGISKTNSREAGIDQDLFLDLLYNTFDLVAEELLVDRMFNVWDKTGEGAIRFEAWVCGLNIFLRAPLEEKILYCFTVYDLNSDGFITKDEIFTLMKNCLLKQPGDEDPDEGVRDLVDIVLKKFDLDKDGRISLEDYKYTVTKEPLLLEAFGQCLPPNSECISFSETINIS